MDRTLQELVKQCRHFVSKRTRFLHWDGPYEKKHDTIPIFENLCYATALMRLKEKESYLEGKELLDRLMAFQMEGKFPYALHDYPKCLKSFDFAVKPFDPTPHTPFWAPFKYSLKDGMVAKQEGFEPKLTQLDQTLAYVHQQNPSKLSPEYLHLALIEEAQWDIPHTNAQPTWIKTATSYTLFWKNKTIDTLALFSSGTIKKSDNNFSIHLPEAEVQDEKEVLLYINRNIHPSFYSEGKRVTAFKLEQPLEIKSDTMHFVIHFKHETQEQLYGHIALANRPTQLLNDGEVYDSCIAIRTIRRAAPLTLNLCIEITPI
jgi:hypothetical protein